MTIAWLPLVLYAAAAAAYLAHFSRPDQRTGRMATALLGGAVLAHTFLIGMQTMEAGYAPLVGTTAAISAFVWLLGLAYLYVELTTDERAMGVFVTVLLAALAVLPALNTADRRAPGAAAQPALHRPRAVAALRVRELRAGVRPRHHLRPALQGDQGQAPRLLLRAAALAADARQDERAGDRGRLGVPDLRPDRRRHLGVADRRLARSAGPGDARRRSRRSCSRWCRGRPIRSRSSPGARSAGADAARRGCRRSPSSSCC